MGVKLQSSSGGSVEIAAPVTASNYVLTAPASTGTIDTLARTGNVLQVVNATYSSQVVSSSSTMADTGLTAVITPTSASSKILVLASQCGLYKTNNNAVKLVLLRYGVQIAVLESAGAYTGTVTDNNAAASSVCIIDTPATTNPITYKTQFASFNNTASVRVQQDNCTSTITLMEIAG